MNLTCYILDDDIYAINAIIKYIERIPNLTLIGNNTNPLIALKEINKGSKPNFVFLDVEMPELSGFDVAELLDKSIKLIFTTAHSKYALQAFDRDAVDFLFKPFSFERFVQAIDKIQAQKDILTTPIKQKEQILIRSGFKSKMVLIQVNEIVHIEALDHYICIHLLKEKHIAYVSMKDFEDWLPPESFIRIHRTHIINTGLIKSVEGSQIGMTNGITIPLSKSFKEEFWKRIEPKLLKNLKG